jgi:anion-transporting  ArsA/GET3 family ATPase
MTGLLDKRFIVVAGKGGVGRTTISLALGQLAASRKKRTLVCLCNAPPRYSCMLGDMILDSNIRRVSNKLSVVNLQPQKSQEEYGLRILRSPVLHRLIFGSRVVRTFLDAVPGLAEWAMLGKATFHALEESGEEFLYDLVVFDSPATGHGLDILALPRAIASTIPTGRMREEAWARCQLLENPDLCEVVPVTLPAEMPVNETVEFVRALKRLKLSVKQIVVNMVHEKKFSPKLVRLLQNETRGEDWPAWLLPTAAARGQLVSQVESLERLAHQVPLPQISLPFLSDQNLDETSVIYLAEILGQTI